MTSIYNLSWRETSFLAKLQLFFKSQNREKQKIQSDDPQVQARGYSALSSTYYSIVGTAFSQLKTTLRPKWLVWLAPVKVVSWCFTWLPISAWCYWRMLSLSNRIVELIGYDGMFIRAFYAVEGAMMKQRGVLSLRLPSIRERLIHNACFALGWLISSCMRVIRRMPATK